MQQITKNRHQETVSDTVVHSANQIKLVDITSEALRRQLAHDNTYAAEKVDAALLNDFRTDNIILFCENSCCCRWSTGSTKCLPITATITPSTRLCRSASTSCPHRGLEEREQPHAAMCTSLRGVAGGALYAVQVISDTGLRDLPLESETSAQQL